MLSLLLIVSAFESERRMRVAVRVWIPTCACSVDFETGWPHG